MKDVLFVCCDGLTGLPDAIEVTWPKAIVQTCVIHLIRAPVKYVSWNERKKVAAALRPVCTAVNKAAVGAALDNLRAGFGKKYPGLLACWDRAWDQFIPFLESGTSIRKVIYTTNAIESINFQLRGRSAAGFTCMWPPLTSHRYHDDTDASLRATVAGARPAASIPRAHSATCSSRTPPSGSTPAIWQ